MNDVAEAASHRPSAGSRTFTRALRALVAVGAVFEFGTWGAASVAYFSTGEFQKYGFLVGCVVVALVLGLPLLLASVSLRRRDAKARWLARVGKLGSLAALAGLLSFVVQMARLVSGCAGGGGPC